MEDFATIIWLLVVIGAAIASRSRKARSRSMEPEPSGTERTRPADTVSHPTPAKETSWPQIPGFPDLYTPKEPAPQKKAAQSPEKPDKRTQSTQKRNITKQPGTAANAPKTTKYTRQSSAPTPIPKPEADPTGKNDPSGAEIAADFDLRKAVIYAEILKPKFDE